MRNRKEPEIHTINYQLTEEDYKNIKSRTLGKLWWIVLIFVGFILSGGYYIIQQTTENTVKKILEEQVVKSRFYEYKEKLLIKAQEDIDEAKNSFIKEIKKYDKMPYSLSENSIKIFDSTGKSFIIEFGKGRVNSSIYFKENFVSSPNLQISLSDSGDISLKPTHPIFNTIYNKRLNANNEYVSYKMTLNIKEVNNKYFKVTYGLDNLSFIIQRPVEFYWIAIGY